MRYSRDLRDRVLDFIEEGGSKAEASRRFCVSLRCVYNWVKAGRDYVFQRPGPRGAFKTDRVKLVRLLAERPDMMLKELAQELGVSISAVWHSLQVMGYSRKKNGALQRGKGL